jgi:hypothetical protein
MKYGREKGDKSNYTESIKRRKNFEGTGHNYYGIWKQQKQMLKNSRCISRDATKLLHMYGLALSHITQPGTALPFRINAFTW